MTTIAEAIKTYLATYTALENDAPIWVDALGKVATEYAISPLPGTRIVETYLDGSSLREFPFAFSSSESTADELERISNIGFYEGFAEWLDTQSISGNLPTLPPTPDTNKARTAEKIESTGWGYLYQDGESSTGIYQINCKLTYHQNA